MLSDPEHRARVESIFTRAPFVKSLGIQLVDLGPGWCETKLALEQRHFQQDGIAHAGVVATMADHTAGAAAGSLLSADATVLTVEYKINLLRPGIGERLRCRAEVLRQGRRVVVAESDVFADAGGTEKQIAKALVTLAIT